MRKIKVAVRFVPLFFSSFLMSFVTVPAAQAQAPAAGTTVSVRMLDAVDSSKDPAGKQYRASVTKAVDAGNGVAIPQGAPAAVTLANGASGYTAQLVSVTVNGQPVAVASSAANVTSAAQSAAGSAVSAVGSMLGGFGHHVSAPSGVAAIATGQRVVLPPGTTLSFVLSQPPAANQVASAASAASAGQPMTASTAAAPTATAASGQLGAYRCYYHGQKATHELSAPADNQIVYVTPIFHAAESARGSVIAAFRTYMPTAYDLSNILGATAGCDSDVQANVPDSQEKQWAAAKTEVVHVNWTYSPSEMAAANAAAAATAQAAAAAAAAGPFISCSTSAGPGIDIYFTGVFQTTRPIKQMPNGMYIVDPSILNDFQAYLKQKGYSFKPGSNSWCDVKRTEAEAKAAQHTRAYGGGGGLGVNCCGNGKVVETGWKP